MSIPQNEDVLHPMTETAQDPVGEDVLLQLSFKRSRLVRGTACLHVRYTMEKHTPYGPISASFHIPCAEYAAKGAAHFDGLMFQKLSAAIALEESQRLFETGSSEAFGVSAAS